MFQSYVYLEIRILLSAVPGVFVCQSESSSKKDILSAKAEFLKRNNSRAPLGKISIQPSALHKVATLVNALGGKMMETSTLEHLTGNIQEPPDDKNFTGFSVKVATGGSMEIMFHQKAKKIQIEEFRIEEDSGHLTRTGGKKAHMDWTYAGCPSVRLRTSAAFELGEEAELFLDELYTLIAYLKLTTGDLGESSVRCNAYVSLSEYPNKPDYFVKLRNLNSFNFVRKAINSELTRQEKILSSGGKAVSESRLWVEEQNTTESFQARKEDLSRFEKIVPEQVVAFAPIAKDSDAAVELPSVRRDRLRKQFGLSSLRALFICAEKDRADFFEQTVSFGSEPLLTSHWMASELMKLLNRKNESIKICKLTPKKFSSILRMLSAGTIHSGIAKSLMQTICATGEDPEELVKKSGKKLISSEKELLPFVKTALEKNEESVRLLRNGDMAPLEYLTGCVMQSTDGCAVPQNVKSIIKKQLQISVVYVLTMGGSITAQKESDGTIRAGNAETIKTLLEKSGEGFPVQVVPVCNMLSEETEPADWAELISSVAERIESGTANGIVITHGTDTLSYTAALMYFLFSAAEVPVVLTASSSIPTDSDEAQKNLALAVQTARNKKKGVYVVYGGKILSPLNLKFISNKTDGFTNWNLSKPVFSSEDFLSKQFLSVAEPDSKSIAELLKEAASHMTVVRLYPGQLGSRLSHLLDDENYIKTIIVELYSTGTCNMRNSDFSLKTLLLNGRKKGCKFYCTSQQESVVDFSKYSTSARAWREGAVPMGILTTESVVALYFASYLIADNEDELSELMENEV